MTKPHAIQTEYKGYKFRSRLEARWAIFLDACKADWEYEPEGYDLGSGTYYLPDFLVHHVAVRDYEHHNDCDVYVEVKGDMTEADAAKIQKFRSCGNKILVVGPFPDDVSSVYGICEGLVSMWYESFGSGAPYYGFDNLDGDSYSAIPCMTRNWKFGIVGNDWCYDLGEYSLDSDLTERAYRLAKQPRFEHGETPKSCHVRPQEWNGGLLYD